MSNLWLNPSLRAHGAAAPRGAGAGGIERRPHAPPQPVGAVRSLHPPQPAASAVTAGRGARHRAWTRAAAVLLLAASAAFSYLAWSDAAPAGAAPAKALRPMGTQRTAAPLGGGAQGDSMRLIPGSPAAAPGVAGSDAVLATRSQVLALRQQNADLHQRLAHVRARLDSAPVPHGGNAGD